MKLRSAHAVHPIHFIILLSLLGVGAVFTLFFSFNRFFQVIAVALTAVSYFLWGLIHHYKQKDLHWEIAIEYFLVALLGAILLITIIQKA